MKSCYDKAIGILRRERSTLERWAQRLLEKETLVDEELGELKRLVGSEQPQPA